VKNIVKISGLIFIIISNLIINSCEKYKISIPISPPLFNSYLTYGTLTDVDNNTYKTIRIGTQIWMAENLKTAKYNDGSSIPLVIDNSAWANLITSGYCWFDNDEATYRNVYGALYNWYTVKTGKLCPTGWHVPVQGEWMTLAAYINDYGGKLKEVGIVHWDSPNMGATNESGFTALPSGFRSYDGVYYSIRQAGFWWSATECTGCYAFPEWIFIDAFDLSLGAGSSGYGNQHDNMLYGYSIRCIKN
jgi:uncharacterized protein (TIGR02145 family)